MNPQQETFYCGSEPSRERALRLISAAPLFDENSRQLVIIIKRTVSGYGQSKKRKFHALINLLAEYLEAPPAAVKKAVKAHLCPLVDELNVITGEVTHEPKGISQLSDEEAAELCEKTVKLAHEHWGVPLPVTEQEWELTKYRGLDALMERESNQEA